MRARLIVPKASQENNPIRSTLVLVYRCSLYNRIQYLVAASRTCCTNDEEALSPKDKKTPVPNLHSHDYPVDHILYLDNAQSLRYISASKIQTQTSPWSPSPPSEKERNMDVEASASTPFPPTFCAAICAVRRVLYWQSILQSLNDISPAEYGCAVQLPVTLGAWRAGRMHAACEVGTSERTSERSDLAGTELAAKCLEAGVIAAQPCRQREDSC